MVQASSVFHVHLSRKVLRMFCACHTSHVTSHAMHVALLAGTKRTRDDDNEELSFSEFKSLVCRIANAKIPESTRGGEPFLEQRGGVVTGNFIIDEAHGRVPLCDGGRFRASLSAPRPPAKCGFAGFDSVWAPRQPANTPAPALDSRKSSGQRARSPLA